MANPHPAKPFLGLSKKTFLLVGLFLIGILVGVESYAQFGGGRRGGRITPEQMEQMKAMREAELKAAQANAQKDEKPKEEEKKADDDKKIEKKDEEKKDDKAGVVTRPTKPAQKADRDELKVTPDKDGYVQFSFKGQPWPDVLQWYADVSGLSFNWTKLPEGFLNLTTQHKYKLNETRDLLNKHLLLHGFTIVVSGDTMTAVEVAKLDPSLIPRVEADELEDHLPHDIVRVRFELPKNMEPEQAAKDVKILTSANAKIQPLLATKRLHVIDTVANLRNVRDLIYAQQAAIKDDIRPVQFMIKHRRADYVADQVMIVLGLDPASRKTPQELQIEQQRMQLYAQMMKKNPNDVSKMLKPGGPEVHLAVNQRRNSILVNADPTTLEIIKRTIDQVDVPDDGGEVVSGNDLTFEKYQTATASTDSIVTALKEIGGLHPLTQLQSDKSSRTIYATATANDHEKIRKMIDRLDGTGRTGHVIWLNRRVAADQAAGTIQALMVGDKDDDSDSRRRRSRYFGYFSYGGDEEEPDQGEMRIQADIENNRLLLWATQAEHAEVRTLLEEIGALANPEAGNPSKLRVFDARSPEETAKMLERLQKAWSGKNPIEIQGLPSTSSEAEPKKSEPRKFNEKNRDKLTLHNRVKATFVQLEQAEAEAADPIRITVTPDGRLVVSSEDPAALDQLEDLMGQLEPPAKDFKVYQLENSRASLVVINLEEYFEEELKGQKESNYDYFGYYSGSRDRDMGPATLGKKRLLRFIWDIDTNTIVVQNASPAQLATIDKLIEIYDRPVGEDAVSARRTEAIPIKYSNATDIANSIKDVFRDLLSSKDKEFQGKEGGGKTRTETYYRFFGGGDSDSKNKKSAPVKMAFEGALSIGVDEISNTLIISAQEQMFDTVVTIVKQLDEKAKPSTVVQVYEVNGNVPTDKLQKALSEALGEPWAGNKPPGSRAKAQNASKKGNDQQNDKGEKK